MNEGAWFLLACVALFVALYTIPATRRWLMAPIDQEANDGDL